jgi:hypothetical protein
VLLLTRWPKSFFVPLFCDGFLLNSPSWPWTQDFPASVSPGIIGMQHDAWPNWTLLFMYPSCMGCKPPSDTSLFSAPGLPCESGGTAILLQEGQTPVQEARSCHQRVGAQGKWCGRGPGCSCYWQQRIEGGWCFFWGYKGREEAIEPFWSIILVFSCVHRACICIVQTRSQMKILNQASN